MSWTTARVTSGSRLRQGSMLPVLTDDVVDLMGLPSSNDGDTLLNAPASEELELPFMKRLLEMTRWLPGDEVNDYDFPRTWKEVANDSEKRVSYIRLSNRSNLRLDRPYETRSRPLLSLAPTTVISAIAGSIERNDYGLYYFELQIKGSDFSQDDPSELEESLAIGFRFADDETEIRYASDGTLKQFPIHEQYALAGVVPHLLSYAAPYKCEDTIGCGFERCKQTGLLQLHFTKNGRLVGYVQYPRSVLSSGPSPVARFLARATVITNFGSSPYACNIEELFSPYVKKQNKFRQDARMLPDEVLHLILIHAVARYFRHSADLKASWQRDSVCSASPYNSNDYRCLRSTSMVCRHWRKLCLPVLNEMFFLSTTAHTKRFIDLFPGPNSPLTSPGLSTWFLSVTADSAPLMANIMVSHVPRHIARALRALVWTGRPVVPTLVANLGSTQGYTFQYPAIANLPVPPRVAMAIPSLFKVLASLDHLELTDHHFPSVTYLLRIVCSLSNLSALVLKDVRCESNELINAPPRWMKPHAHLRRICLDRSDASLPGFLWLLVAPYRPRFTAPSCKDSPIEDRPNIDASDVSVLHSIIDEWIKSLGSPRPSCASLTYCAQMQGRTWDLNVHVPTVPLHKLTVRIGLFADPRRKEQVDGITTITYSFEPWEGAHVLQPFCHKLNVLVGRLSNFPHVACRFILPPSVHPSPQVVAKIRWQFRKLMPAVAAVNAVHVHLQEVPRCP